MRYGNSTELEGYNQSTGSEWRQNSTTVGDTTFHEGESADGGNWEATETRIGRTRYIDGTDSDGNSFSYVCDEYGCY